MVAEGAPRPPKDLPAQLANLVESGRRGDAVELFQTRLVGIPEQVVVQMRNAPFRPALEATAHTLVHEATIVGDLTLPEARLRSVKVPTLAVYGGESPALMGGGGEAGAHAGRDGHVRSPDGPNHANCPPRPGPLLLGVSGPT